MPCTRQSCHAVVMAACLGLTPTAIPAYVRLIQALRLPTTKHSAASELILGLQAITEPDERYEAYCRSSDFIREHVFPGGHLPSLGAMVDAAGGTGLLVHDVADIGPGEPGAQLCLLLADGCSAAPLTGPFNDQPQVMLTDGPWLQHFPQTGPSKDQARLMLTDRPQAQRCPQAGYPLVVLCVGP